MHGNGGEDPTEGHRSEPYPWPAVSHEDRIQQIHDGLDQGGYHPFHAPCGILLNEADRPRSTCIRCTWCDGYPCMVHAKADADVMAVRPALGRDNLTLLTGAEVTKLETDDTGRTVTGVVVSRDGNREVYTADIVAISAGAANSAKILLNSASDAHPRGLANGSDQVGRNYMFHNCKAVVALSKEKNDTVFQKTLGINDFYFATKNYEYPMGNIQMIGKSNAEAMRGEKPKLTKLSPEWTLTDVASTRWTSGSPPRTCRNPGTASRPTATATSTWRTPRPTTRRPTASTVSSRRSSTTPGWPSTTSWARTSTWT